MRKFLLASLVFVGFAAGWILPAREARADDVEIPAFVPPTVQISPYGRQIAEDFLMQFPTMFGNRFNDWWGAGSITEGEQRLFGIPRQHGTELEDGRIQAWEIGRAHV